MTMTPKFAESVSTLKKMRSEIVRIAASSGEGHIPSALSILEILWVEYAFVIAEQTASGEVADRFILSKGHGSLAIYAVLAELGLISIKDFNSFAKFESKLGGHPDRSKVTCIEASTGSLGHGMPIAVGMALSKKIRRERGRVVTLIGDGEANEGTIWESALLASHHGLSNLICIIDHNHSTDRALAIDPVAEKFIAFGWNAIEIEGHDLDALYVTLAKERIETPTVVVARTIKGHGVAVMENNPAWHHASPNSVDLEVILKDLA